MIHESKLFEAIQPLKTFSLKWVSKKGELVVAEQCRYTSFHSSGKTMNVMLLPSNMFRKVNRKTIVEINGQEVFL